ncbi:MAG: SusD/RagB family nutrient-binding outer membrane lipoprotein [Parafilimonas sp.]|nr:SusD/RagB family nutrient-binding outer membrane lipoprotein [Parafilimonas sp.]
MKKQTIIVISLIYLLAGASCKKGYLDINSNPNNSTDVGPELILPAALNSTAGRLITDRGANGYPAISGWMGQWAVSGSYAVSNAVSFYNYNQTTDWGEGLWDDIYNNLEDYYQVETQAAAQNKPFYVGVAKIMMSHEFQQLVDMFGSVPYLDALKGTNVIQPTYTDAQAIYEDLINQIDSGINDIKVSQGAGVPTGKTSDIMFDGDVTSWVQFANTLKLRILLRQTQMSGRDGYIQSHINDIKNEGSGFLTTDAGASPGTGYINSAGKQNPFWGFNYNTSGTYINDFWRANQFALDFYQEKNDPRRERVYGPTPSDPNAYAGNFLGQSTGALVGSATSIFGPGVLKSVSQPSIVISAAESYFLQSEAVLRGYLGGDAEDLYHQGITASFEFYGVADADAAAQTYYSQVGKSDVYWDNSRPFDYKLNLIIAQKWCAENTVTPFEEWCDYRRLPNLTFNQEIPLTQSIYAEDPKIVPYRILYPTSEYGTNGDNLPDQADNAYRTDKIFWMP